MRIVFLKLLIIFFCLPQANYSFSQSNKRILILSNYNVNAESIRKNKKEFFTELNNTLLNSLFSWCTNKQFEPVLLSGYTSLDSGSINLLQSIIQHNNCTNAIVVNKFDVYFSIDNVDVTKNANGKSKEAHYNIYSMVNYSFFDTANLIKTDNVISYTSHSSRAVISGLFATGPNIMNNKDDARNIIEANVEQYMFSCFNKNQK